MFDPTNPPVYDSNGDLVSKVRCAFYNNWNAGNTGSVQVSSPGGSFVTDSCDRGQIGPKRDCGFATTGHLQSCAAGAPVTLSCNGGRTSQVVRACEVSQNLGVGTACTLLESAANAVVGSTGATLAFTCPTVRDAPAGSGIGGYQLYQAPLLPWQTASLVNCSAQ